MRIAAAAIRWNGLTISKPRPARHHDLLRPAFEATGLIGPEDQGFITDEGEFVGREAAYNIADAAGQIVKAHRPGTLFSEDVW